MTDGISRSLLAAIALPPPPGTQRQDGVSTFVVIAIVVAILGGVVLIAWLLKPIVARRLIETDIGEVAAEGEEAPAEPTPPETEVPTAIAASTGERGDDVEPILDSRGGAETAARVRGVGADEVAGITATVRELIDDANAGQLLRGFALYTEPFLQRFRAETGLSESEFEATFGATTAPPPEARAEIEAVTDFETLPDGRVRALVTYRDGGAAPPPERFTFVRADGDRWLIDDIAAAE